MFITFEGIDGAGKSVQAKRFVQQLKNNNNSVLHTREPGGGGHVGDVVRQLLLSVRETDVDAELLLIYAARRQHIRLNIKPAIASNKIVVCDRYFDSSVAYYAINKPFLQSLEIVQTLHRLFCCDLMPLMTFLIDVDPTIARTRVLKRNMADKYQDITHQQMSIVRGNFLQLQQLSPERIIVIDGNQSEDLVFKNLWEKWAQISYRKE